MLHKTEFATVVLASLLLSAQTAPGMYTPNPAGRWAPDHFFLAGDFQFNSSKDLDFGGGHSQSLDNMAGFFVRPSYSIARNVVIHGRLGFQTADNIDTGFAGGFGIQGAYQFPAAPAWAVGGAFDYMHWSADIQNGGPNINWNEFQLSPAVSYRIPTFKKLTPYAGLMFDFVDARDSVSQSDPVGLLMGTNFDPNPHLRLDFQLRVISETGFLLSAGYLF
jgi:hypothetical protein